MIQVVRLVASLDAQKSFLVELRGQLEVVVLSKEISKLIHYAEGVIIFVGDLLETVFQGLYDLFTLNWLFDGQV